MLIRTSQFCAFIAAALLVASSWCRPLELQARSENGLSPDHEVARTLWNNARKLHRRLNRPQKRDTAGTQMYGGEWESLSSVLNETAALNITAPKYMLELYSRLSNPYLIANTQANTIRTLQISSKLPVCGEFNFSIESINSSEYILKSELHLYLEEPSQTGNYLVFVKLFNRMENGRDVATSEEIIITKGEGGWHVFRVDDVVHNWVRNGKTHAVFKIQVYHYDDHFSGPLACADEQVRFAYTRDDPDKEPFLVVYSYDDEVERINYGLIMERLELELEERPTVATPSVSTTTDLTNQATQKRKRQVSEVELNNYLAPSCSVQTLNVTATDLNRIPVIRSSEVLLPTSYNAGVCGGKCGTKFPRGPQHAALIHILLNSGTFNDRHGYTFSQCCAPVRYTSLETLTRSLYRHEYRINILTNMKIMQCECLDVIDYSQMK